MIWLFIVAFLVSLSANAPVKAQGVGGPGGNPNNPIAPNQPCPDDSNRIANTHFVHECGGGGGGGGSIPLGLGFTITAGQDNPTAGALATPLVIGTNTLFGQIDPLELFTDTTLTAVMMAHNVKAMAGVSIAFTLPQAGLAGFEKGTSICFVAQGTGGLTLTAAGGSLLHGVPVSANVMTSPQYGNGCAASDGTDWDISWAFPAGTGSVTSITAGSHITLTPNPIVSTGTVAFTQMATNTVVANPTSGTANAQDLAVPSCSADHEALQWTTDVGFGCPVDFAQFDKNQTWSKNQAMGPVILTDGAAIATDGLLRNYYKVTLAGNNHVLSNPTNLQPGNYTWYVYQDGTGGRTGFATGTNFLFIGGTPNWDGVTTAGTENLISCLVDDVLQMACTAGLDVGGAGGALTITLTGDTTGTGGTSIATTAGKVHGVTYPASPSTNTVPVVTSSNTVTYEAVPFAALAALSANQVLGALTATTPSGLSLPSCVDSGGNHLNYTSGTGFSCGTSGGGAASLTVGSSVISGGTSGRVLYDNAGVLGEMTTSGSGTVLALATGPSISGLTVTSSLTATGLVTLADIATEAANTVLANVTAGTASPTAASLPSCTDTGGNHLNYTNGTGFSCGTSGGAAGSLVVGTTTISSGSTGRLLYDNAGVLGEPTMTASVGALTLGSTTGPVAGSVTMWGSTSGSLQVKPAAAAGTSSVLTLPGGTTDFSASGGTSQVVKQVSAGAALTIARLACADLSDAAGGCSTAGGTTVLNTSALIETLPNDTGTGTTAAKLVKMTNAGNVVIATTADTSNVIGICVSGITGTSCGTSGNASVAIAGQASCVFDNATTAGDYVVVSTGTNGDCHDAGSTVPATVAILGQVLSTNGGAGTYSVDISPIGAMAANNKKLTTLTSAHLYVGNASNVATDVAVSGVLTLANTGAFSFASGAAANPSGTVGLSAVNGSNATFLRSDGAPALSQSISPTWTGTHIFTNSLIKLLGSSTGATTFTSANAGASNFTLTLPAVTDTLAALGTAQTWSAVQTYGNGQITPNNAVVATLLATGTSVTLTAPREYYVCTGTCTVTVPVPAAGNEFCIMNDDNVATAITLAALGSSARYENTARTAYGTAGTGTLVSTAAAASKVCILGLDSTHYLTTTYTGTWTAS